MPSICLHYNAFTPATPPRLGTPPAASLHGLPWTAFSAIWAHCGDFTAYLPRIAGGLRAALQQAPRAAGAHAPTPFRQHTHSPTRHISHACRGLEHPSSNLPTCYIDAPRRAQQTSTNISSTPPPPHYTRCSRHVLDDSATLHALSFSAQPAARLPNALLRLFSYDYTLTTTMPAYPTMAVYQRRWLFAISIMAQYGWTMAPYYPLLTRHTVSPHKHWQTQRVPFSRLTARVPRALWQQNAASPIEGHGGTILLLLTQHLRTPARAAARSA